MREQQESSKGARGSMAEQKYKWALAREQCGGTTYLKLQDTLITLYTPRTQHCHLSLSFGKGSKAALEGAMGEQASREHGGALSEHRGARLSLVAG